jgi:hypothetical protein
MNKHEVNKQIYILRTLKLNKVNWLGHILCRNFLLKHNIYGKTEEEEEDVSKYCMNLRKKEIVDCEITQNRNYTINIHEHASRN